jgi:hypothetical protein
MTTSERARAELYERLDETLGPDPADTLMGYLPPVGWADVATKADIHALESKIDATASRLEARFERALRGAVLAMMATTIATVSAAVGAAVAITQLMR